MATNKVELSVECLSLVFTDKSPDNIQIRLLEQQSADTFQCIAETEKTKKDPNPKFHKQFLLLFKFENIQPLRFEVSCVGSDSREVIGFIDTTLGRIVGGGGLLDKLVSKESEGRDVGTIVVNVNEIRSGICADIYLKITGQNLERKDTFGKSDPFLEFSRTQDDGSWRIIHKTEHIKQNLNPVWNPFKLDLASLFSDESGYMRIQCYDWNKNGKNEFIGQCNPTYSQMEKGGTFDLINDQKKKKKDTKIQAL
jgi:hypothetical protein